MSASSPGVHLTLTNAQVEQTVRKVAGGGGTAGSFLAALLTLGSSLDVEELKKLQCSFGSEKSVSQSILIASKLKMSTATTHRYVKTWLLLGLLEQDPETHEYRRSA
jgi:hypothetical protein